MENENTHLIVSGTQPTGRLHVGHLAGLFRNQIKLQEDHPGRCLFFIADYHSMTVEYDPAEKPGQVMDFAASLLALGIGDDPKEVTLFVQSHVPEVTELAWIFETVTPVSEMLKMTQYKDKSAKNEKNVNMGLLNYPVLQAADILMYKGTHVPVGDDQVQHVETSRVIARNFNRRFGEIFPEPKELLTPMSRVKSLTDPTLKMSKSGPEKSFIALDDGPDAIIKKIAGVPTEPTGTVTEDELAHERKFAGVALLFDLLEMFGSTEEKTKALAGETVRYGDLKKRTAEAIIDGLADFRKKKAEYLKDETAVREALATGGDKARAIAAATMEDVRKKTGLR